MNALEIIDRIEELIDSSKRIPFSSNVLVNSDEIFDLLDELRNVLPEELRQSRWIVKERENMIAEAKKQAEKVIIDAEQKAEALVNESEIMKRAMRRSEEMLSSIEAKSRTIRLEAEDYADEKLASLEVVLHKLLNAIEKGREHFKNSLSSGSK
ncbi:MAG: ATPase [Actinobacteria bacterium]|nr:ATPase [Actinomycetota bacterium]